VRPLRSLLFVPGYRGTWMEKALAPGVNGLILDLEGSRSVGRGSARPRLKRRC
jgi:citrate lyase subunit beta/citryl-CoA lyase